MIGIFNTIIIDGKEIFRPNAFALQREQIYSGEIETCTGKRLADRVGWRYADLSLGFDTLPQDQLNKLLSLTGAVTMTFVDEQNNQVSEQVILKTSSATATRFTKDGHAVWSGINAEVQFLNAHNN